MEAIEFTTILHNQTVILPPEYGSQWEGKSVRVLIIDDSQLRETSTEPRPKKPFQAISLNTKGFKLNREQANVR